MTDETHVDGNALGGLLMEVFGHEMTDARGCCDSCGTENQVGAMLVYRGPGDVMRCPTCASVVIVAVTIHERNRLHLSSLRWLEPASPDFVPPPPARLRLDRTQVIAAEIQNVE